MINKRFLGKGGIVDYQTSNTAYDKLAFIADHYQDMVKMYDTIMAHLKLPNNEGGGGGCNYLKHTYSGIPLIIKLGDVTKYGYDISKPDDIEIIRQCLSVTHNGFTISKPMYAEEFKCTVKQLATPRGKYLLDLFTESAYSSFLDKYGDISNYFRIYGYGFSTQVSRIENGVAYDTENNPIKSTYSTYIDIELGNINQVATELGSSLPDTVKCLVLAKKTISSINNNYIVGYSDTLYSDYNSASGSEEKMYKEVTLNNVFIFPCISDNDKYSDRYSSSITLFSKDRTVEEDVNGTGYFNLIYAASYYGDDRPALACGNLLGYKNGLMYTVQGGDYKCDITDNYCTDIVMEYS